MCMDGVDTYFFRMSMYRQIEELVVPLRTAVYQDRWQQWTAEQTNSSWVTTKISSQKCYSKSNKYYILKKHIQYFRTQYCGPVLIRMMKPLGYLMVAQVGKAWCMKAIGSNAILFYILLKISWFTIIALNKYPIKYLVNSILDKTIKSWTLCKSYGKFKAIWVRLLSRKEINFAVCITRKY